MSREELDTLWFQAMRESMKAGEDFTRYHFAALVAAAERDACAELVDGMNVQHPKYIAAAIRARGDNVRTSEPLRPEQVRTQQEKT